MFTFCDVLHETLVQKSQINSRECTVRSGNHLYQCDNQTEQI